MKEILVNHLEAGKSFRSRFLIQRKERKIASTGSPYLDLDLQDSSGVIRAKLWDCDRHDLSFEADDVVEVDGQAENFQGTLQVRLRKIVKCDPQDVDLLDYLPRTERDPDEMYTKLLERLRRMPEGPLRALLLAVIEDPAIAGKLKLAPAAASYHHAYLGGLLEHVSSLTDLGDLVCDHYPSLRRDLVLTGLVLHDLGKIEELAYRGGFRYSTRGQLVGHLAIALETVQTKISEIPDFPGTLKDQIEHIILSHHGKLEFGSPKEPMFPEALVVHYLDDLDSKLESMRAQYAADRDRPGDWTARNPALKRELLRLSEEPVSSTPAGGAGGLEP